MKHARARARTHTHTHRLGSSSRGRRGLRICCGPRGTESTGGDATRRCSRRLPFKHMLLLAEITGNIVAFLPPTSPFCCPTAYSISYTPSHIFKPLLFLFQHLTFAPSPSPPMSLLKALRESIYLNLTLRHRSVMGSDAHAVVRLGCSGIPQVY